VDLTYSDPRYHLVSRQEVTEEWVPGLFDVDRDHWPQSPMFIMWPSRLRRLHASILDASDNLTDGLKTILDQPEGSLQEVLGLTGMSRLGLNLIDHVEIHHRTEDKHILPKFLVRFPNLRPAISLIDNDHLYLDKVMMEAVDLFKKIGREGAQKTDVAAALGAAETLDYLLQRHTHDEENILIPAVLSEA